MAYRFSIINKALQVNLQGNVDLAETATLKTEFEAVMSSEVTSVIVFADNLAYIDSSGVASLLFMRKLAARFGSQFIIESISSSAARVIQLANLDNLLGLKISTPVTSLVDSKKSNPSSPSLKFSDADALAIFKNNTDISLNKSNIDVVGDFAIKPSTFT
jgi:anti-anti-sigma factor